ncbi:MAG TPA: hypothetical protein VMN03_14805 [Burkholderiales bacterium]|nr:hypothetical protein [Burkholderiales bacterium]
MAVPPTHDSGRRGRFLLVGHREGKPFWRISPFRSTLRPMVAFGTEVPMALVV